MLVPPTALALAALLSYAPAAPAQAPNVATRESTFAGTVEKIQAFTRLVTFRLPGNILRDVYVDPQVKEFNDLRVGDAVTVHYVESFVVQVRPEARPSTVRDTTGEARAAKGENVVQQQTMVVTIETVDLEKSVVQYMTADNRRVMQAVANRQLLAGLNPGDRVEVTFTRERAVRVERGPH